MTIELRIAPISNEAAELYKQMKGPAHEGDSGIDLYANEDMIIHGNGEIGTIRMGICMEAIRRVDQTNISYLLMPRSSIYKKKLVMANSIGLIDAGYRGEIVAKVYNFTNQNIRIDRGERLFQLVMFESPHVSKITMVHKEDLSTTHRGEGGHGSTGSK